MHSIHLDLSIDTLMIIVIFNVLGTGMQVLLKYLHDTKKYQWSDGPLKAVNFMMAMVGVLIANRRHPLTAPEAGSNK